MGDALTGEHKGTAATGRMLSLDAFRGITIAGMILVNNSGSWEHIYSPVEHAAWHGWTPTDLVFPFFLFIVGVSITLSLARRAEGGGKRDLYVKIVRRALIIFALGLALTAFPYNDAAGFRIPGVLQRFAVCYWLIDIKGYRAWAKPFLVFGSNALAVYFLSEAFVRTVDALPFKTADGHETNLLALVYEKVFAPLASPVNSSLMFAVCTVLFWLGVMWILYRRRVFIKV